MLADGRADGAIKPNRAERRLQAALTRVRQFKSCACCQPSGSERDQTRRSKSSPVISAHAPTATSDALLLPNVEVLRGSLFDWNAYINSRHGPCGSILDRACGES